MRPVRQRCSPRLVALAAALALTACGASGADPVTVPNLDATVATGQVPEPLSDAGEPSLPPLFIPDLSVTEPTEPTEPIEGPVGDLVNGNRVIAIGDTVLAATAPRNGGTMCEVLNGFGWDVEVDAEPGRFVDFGTEVLDERLRPDDGVDWDAAVVFLGNHFDGDLDAYIVTLDDILDRLAPRPTIVFTMSELDAEHAQLNAVIRERPRFHLHAIVVDWAEFSSGDPEVVLRDGGPQLTEEGAARLVVYVAGALGQAPGDGVGECLPSDFTDDSAIVL